MFAKELFALLVVLGLVFSAPVAISACQEISAPGEYYLDMPLSGLDGANQYCIKITSGNVSFDCAGYYMEGLGSGTGIEIKAGENTNNTVKNCNVYNYDYGLYGDPKDSVISNNRFRRNNQHGMFLTTSTLNRIEYNNISENSNGGAYLSGDNNTVVGNRFFSNWGEGIGLNVKGHYNSISENNAYDNDGSGISISGNENELFENTVYGNDWEMYSGAGIEVYGYYNELSENVAYDNTNGFYIEGPLPPMRLEADLPAFGNTFTDNHAYENLVGLNVIDNNGTYTDNLLEENLEADFLVGGDMWIGGSFLRGGLRTSSSEINPEAMCDNIFANTGSGGRPIYFTNKTATLTSGTYSEAIVCDADNSKLSGLAISGSDTLDNNGMLLFFTEDAEIKSSNSKNNFLGFGFVMSDGNSLEGSNSDGSGLGIVSVYSRDLTISDHSSANNRMESTLLFDLFQMFLEGGSLTGEPARAPVERPDIGAGALFLLSPRATLTDASFSGSTMGALFIMSDESKISGGGAFDNDLLGYGFIESYNGTISGARISGNDGNIYDILGERIPDQYEILKFLPLGAGVFDFSISLLEGLPITGGEMQGSVEGCPAYAYCDMEMGSICDFETGSCARGTFENQYKNSRVYENGYGLVLLSRGHETVDGCTIFDNKVLGVLDVSDNLVPGGVWSSHLAASEELPPAQPKAVTITRTRMYRNGEQVFATMADLFEEAGMEGWYKAFALLDNSIPKGVFEFEIVEASAVFDIMPVTAMHAPPTAQGIPWLVNHSTLGAGASSVEISIDDNSTAVYIISDTTLPSVRKISFQDEDIGIDLTAHLQNEGVKNKAPFLNKYFLVGAFAENPDLSASTPTGPEITSFQVHYGGASGYDAETMGLYYLNIYRTGGYCEDNMDCPRGYGCYENICNEIQCESDDECPLSAPTGEYCVGYICSECRDDSDCTGDGTACREQEDGMRRCGYEFCIQDSECPAGQYCDLTRARCAPEILGGERSSPLLPLSEIANREVSLKAELPSGDFILKGRWTPVVMQNNSPLQRTITAESLTPQDQTKFINNLLGDIIPEGYLLYGNIYGLFATRTPGTGDDDEPITYVCDQDSDCGECEFCSTDNNQCLPKEAAQCGVFGRECREGYTCEGCECMPPECTTDSQCQEGYKCLDYSCVGELKEEPQEEPQEPGTGESGEAGEPGTPPAEEVVPPEPEEEAVYPLVEVSAPSVQAPKQPVSESQAEFQNRMIGVVFLLVLGLVAVYWYIRMRMAEGPKPKKK